MEKEIKNARWANDSKTKIFCEYHYKDGRVLEAYISQSEEGNPDWKEIVDVVGEEELQRNAIEFLRKRDQRRNDSQRQKEKEEAKKNEIIFNAKLDTFSIEEIKSSKNTKLKSKIRRAKSLQEVNMYTTLLLMHEMRFDLFPELKKDDE